MELRGIRQRRGALTNNNLDNKGPGTISAEYCEFERSVRAEISAVIDESLSRHKMFLHDRSDVLRLLEDEAQKMYQSVEAANVRDGFARRHNQRMAFRENMFRLVGMLILLCPASIAFSAIMMRFPERYLVVLADGARGNDLLGWSAGFCLGAVNMADLVAKTNTASGGFYVWVCGIALAGLLLLVRYTTVRQGIMSNVKREQMHIMRRIIGEELNRRREELDADINQHLRLTSPGTTT